MATAVKSKRDDCENVGNELGVECGRSAEDMGMNVRMRGNVDRTLARVTNSGGRSSEMMRTQTYARRRKRPERLRNGWEGRKLRGIINVRRLRLDPIGLGAYMFV